MGLVSKLKNILFEEEEVEIPVIEKKEKKVVAAPTYKEMPRKEEVKEETPYRDFYEERTPVVSSEKKVEDKRTYSNYEEPVSEREIFKSEKTFNFPAFDEKEFESVVPKRTTNVMEYERKRQEKKNEYKRPERKEEEKTVKTKFKPSPIISPVYGILDKNYTPDEITTRTEDTSSKALDVDSVRKKAFGTLEEKNKIEVSEEIKVEEEHKIMEEKLEKARTIDELLKDSSDDYIDIDDEVEENKSVADDIDTLEEIEPKHEANLEEDTLESDLFDLIDSMYENREDGE